MAIRKDRTSVKVCNSRDQQWCCMAPSKSGAPDTQSGRLDQVFCPISSWQPCASLAARPFWSFGFCLILLRLPRLWHCTQHCIKLGCFFFGSFQVTSQQFCVPVCVPVIAIADWCCDMLIKHLSRYSSNPGPEVSNPEKKVSTPEKKGSNPGKKVTQ